MIIPSFHRPGILRYDPKNGVNDWARTNPAGNWADSAARILRPVAADGHDPATFPDLVPDPATGKITFDVDNDADGVTDSVWLDLGYPARPDCQWSALQAAVRLPGHRPQRPDPSQHAGNLGIPLNSAGNLAATGATGPTHAAHLGNSVSELDPTYALQNANQGPAIDADPFNVEGIGMPPYTSNTQVDNAGVDVRLTQLRNLLAGTRPQPNPTTSDPVLADPHGMTNGDDNFVFGAWPGTGGGQPYFMPNGIADPGDVLISTNPPQVQRTTPAVPGRWGESPWIPGQPVFAAGGQVLNLVANPYNNPVRAGYSFGIADLLNGDARAAADDNYNQFDSFSDRSQRRGQRPRLLRLRRWADAARRPDAPVRHAGRHRRIGPGAALGRPLARGRRRGRRFGRVDFAGYFRPPGAPGVISTRPIAGSTPGAIVYPSANNDLFYTVGPNPANLAFPSYLPDVTNNPLHGFEAAKNPNLPSASGGYAPQANGGMPADENVAAGIPDAYPTYDLSIRTNGLNEADEMNLYRPNPLLDSPFAPPDLEWLYRSQDVDGPSLLSRLADLAPISFTNTIDGQRRRRLFAVESWESNQFDWANDNPQNAFPFNSRFAPTANASFATASAAIGSYVAAPALAHRDQKINLNYPLPVSNDPDEPIRRKWINDTYQLLKWVLPPRAVDTPEELAQLSQFVINIIDFRDPDCTMTHWQNPDVLLVPGQPATAPTLVLASSNPANAIPLDQYGMEYNPVALNEVLAFSYAYSGRRAQANRFFVELVNTLTQSAFAALPPPAGGGTNPPDPSILDLGGFQYTPGDPYSGGCWDLVFTDDTPNSRPDPYRGELVQGGQFYALIPLNKDSFTASRRRCGGRKLQQPRERRHAGAAGSGGRTVASGGQPGIDPSHTADELLLRLRQQSVQPGVRDGDTVAHDLLSATAVNGIAANTPSLVQYLSPAADPFNGPATPEDHLVPGRAAGGRRGLRHLHGLPAAQLSVETSHPDRGEPDDRTKYYWVCLRRPANPFAPVSAANPMLVVDAMRFPYIDGTVTGSTVNTVYSAQRFQPYRGGHAVPVATGTPAGVAAAQPTLDARYGYTEQIAGAGRGLSDQLGTNVLKFDQPGVPHPGDRQRPGRALGLLPLPRSRLHRRGRADAGAGLPAGAVHQAIRRVRPVADQLGQL